MAKCQRVTSPKRSHQVATDCSRSVLSLILMGVYADIDGSLHTAALNFQQTPPANTQHPGVYGLVRTGLASFMGWIAVGELDNVTSTLRSVPVLAGCNQGGRGLALFDALMQANPASAPPTTSNDQPHRAQSENPPGCCQLLNTERL